MSNSRFMLSWDVTGWQLIELHGQGSRVRRLDVAWNAPAEQVAEAVAQAIPPSGRRIRIVLAVSSQRCLAATVTVPPHRSRFDATSLTYALEEVLPWAAEEFRAGFIHTKSISTKVLGVAMETASLAPIVDALQARAIIVDCVTATSLLALQNCSALLNDTPTQVVLWNTGSAVDGFQLNQGKPTEWTVLPSEPSVVRQWLGTMLLARSPQHSIRLVEINLGDDLNGITCDWPGVEFVQHEVVSMASAAADEAHKVLAGRVLPWVDFRAARHKGQPVSGWLNFAACTAVVCCLALTTSLLIRAYRYQQLTNRMSAEQATLFQAAFPGQAVPNSVRLRLQSESDRLAETAENVSQIRPTQSALQTFYHVLQAWPENQFFRLFEARLDADGSLVLEGDVDSPTDCGPLVSSLTDHGFRVEPPQIENQDNARVAIQLTAVRPR